MAAITMPDLPHMSVPERLRLVEELRNTIAAEAHASPERLPLGEGVRLEFRRRSEEYRRNPHDVIGRRSTRRHRAVARVTRARYRAVLSPVAKSEIAEAADGTRSRSADSAES
jgi:putative addiction module component (TIGR02574 family)